MLLNLHQKLQKMFYMCSIFVYYTAQILNRTGGVLYIVFWHIEQPYHHCILSTEMDKKLESWTYWDTWGILNGPEFVENKAKYFVRPYPTATYGVPHSLSFDVNSAAFAFDFYPAVEDLTIPTEIFVPEMHYPNMSYDLTVSADLTFTQEGTVLKVFATKASSPTVLSSVTISPQNGNI